MNDWLVYIVAYFFFFATYELIIKFVLKPIWYKISGKEAEDADVQRRLRGMRVEIFGKKVEAGQFKGVIMVDAKNFGYDDAYHMWQELSDHYSYLLTYFKPLAKQAVYINHKDESDEQA